MFKQSSLEISREAEVLGSCSLCLSYYHAARVFLYCRKEEEGDRKEEKKFFLACMTKGDL